MLNTLSVTTSFVFAVLAASSVASAAQSPCGYTWIFERDSRAPSINEAWFSASE